MSDKTFVGPHAIWVYSMLAGLLCQQPRQQRALGVGLVVGPAAKTSVLFVTTTHPLSVQL